MRAWNVAQAVRRQAAISVRTLARALEGAVQTGHAAENQAAQAISGQGGLTDVVTALAHAELTLQTATAVRDRVVQAYQDIIRMPI